MLRLSIVATIAIVAVLIFGDQTVRIITAALVALYMPIAVKALHISAFREATADALRRAASIIRDRGESA